MQPTDNDMQPGTGKNARRMCLNHQTIQNFYIIGTKIKKGKKKKGGGGKSLKLLDFLDRVSVEESYKVMWPWALGGAGTRTAAPQGAQPWSWGSAMSSAHFLCQGHHMWRTQRGFCWTWLQKAAQIRGCWRPQPTPSTVGRGATHRNAAFPQKNLSFEVLAGPAQVSGALGQGGG